MQIKMLRFYCGYLNEFVDFQPGEIREVPNDNAVELIAREYAVNAEQPTRVVEANKEAASKVTRKLK